MGEYAAAARYYEQGLALDWGWGTDDDILVGLKRCETELQSANRRKKRKGSTSRPRNERSRSGKKRGK